MTAAIIACVRFLQPRKLFFAGAFGLAVLVCGVASLRLVAHEDIRALVPDGDPRLAGQFALMRDAPFLHTLRIAVGGKGLRPQTLSDSLAAALQSPEIPFVAKGPGTLAARDLPRLLESVPLLLPPERIALLEKRLGPESVREALRKDRQLLLGPSGPALRGLVARDPLGLHADFLGYFASVRGLGGIPAREGYFTDPSGEYCMVVAKPSAAMTDAAASAAVMARVREAVASLPEGAKTLVTGSYRHSEANARIVKSDLARVLPASLLGVAALFLIFLRNMRALTLFAVPLAALCVAGVATAVFYGGVSGIVLGFGSVVLGITADYAIHTYYAVTRAESLEKGIAEVCPPLLAGACTTAFAFAALLFSGVPAIRQLGFFGLAGIGTALFASFSLLPLVLRPRCARAEPLRGNFPPSSPRPARVRPLFAAAVFALLGAVLGTAFFTLRFDGDIRNLAYAAPEITRDEARFNALWNLPKDGAFLVTAAEGTDEGVEKALQRNDRVWEILRDAGVAASGLAPFLPSRERQNRSLAAWKELWDRRGEATLAELDAAAPEFGFAPGAFSPFKAWMRGQPPMLGLEGLRSGGFAFLPAMLADRTPERAAFYTMLPGNGTPDATLLRDLEQAGARHVSGAGFRAAMGEAMGKDIFRFCLLTVIAVVLAIALVFRSPLRCLAVLLPMLAGLAFTVSLVSAAGMAVTVFHAVALPLVMALSVDYGIFMQAVIEGRMDAGGKKGVLLSALTTLAGFGSLLLARHPALFALGLAVTGGIAAALAAALWVQPRLFTGNGKE